ncbi:MAG: hypothetical protein ACQKBT_00155, partial [Puniceicoccales bacterium]
WILIRCARIFLPMLFRRISFLFLGAILLLAAVPASADDSALQTEVDAFAPNKTINEEIIAFGTNVETAERAAMIRAWKVSRNGVFKVKNVVLNAVDNDDYCILDIEHRIYEPSDTTRVLEMVVGFGSSPQDALSNSRVKAMQRIRDNPRSRPNLRNSTLPGRSQDYLPMPKEDERDFIEDNIRFWGSGNNWRVYLKFEYLEMK